jgi:adenosylhomocysteinase
LSNNGIEFPVFDVGLSYCKYELGNVYGTGVSAIVAISCSANVNWAAKRVLVVGYGAVGRSVANAARSVGAHVLVADKRLKNLARAHCDGHEVGVITDLLPRAQIVVTCSGSGRALTCDMLSMLPDNTIVANVGCFASEIDVRWLRANASHFVRRERQIETFWLPSGRQIHLLAGAELVNLSIGRGWPIELIDLCFSLSTLCFAEIWTASLRPGLQPVPAQLEEAALSLFFNSGR